MICKFEIRWPEKSIVIGKESFPLSEIRSVRLNHRAFRLTGIFLLFLLSLLLGALEPYLLLLLVGIFFVMLRFEFSRYIELIIGFRDGSVRRVMGSFRDRDGLYKAADDLQALTSGAVDAARN